MTLDIRVHFAGGEPDDLRVSLSGVFVTLEFFEWVTRFDASCASRRNGARH